MPGLMIYRYDSPLFFANAENFRSRARAAVDAAQQPVRWFVLNSEAIRRDRHHGVEALEGLRAGARRRGMWSAMARLKQDLREQLWPER